MLDILANNNWERPIYFTGGSNADDEYLWMKDYLQMDGMAFQLVPIKTPNEYGVLGMGRVETERNYKLMKSWDFGNHGKDFYLDPESRRNSISYRNNISRVVEALMNEGDFNKAEELLDISYNKLPIDKYKQYGVCLGFPEQYYLLNKPEKARKAANVLIKQFQEYLQYYAQFSAKDINYLFSEVEMQFKMYQTIAADVNKYEKDETYKKQVEDEFISHIKLFEDKLQ